MIFKSRNMRCVEHVASTVGMKNAYKISVGEERENLGNQVIDGRIILKRVLKEKRL
jgi:hypothetical protein